MAANTQMIAGKIATEYTRRGFALCAIPLGKKGPITKEWNLFEKAITASDDTAYLTGNIGLLHAWSGTMAIDVDDCAAASEWLLARGVNLAQLFSAADRVEIVSGRVGRGKLLYRLPKNIRPIETLKIKDSAGSTILEFRCADAGGNSVQDVLPPSIHPDTGKPYCWGGPGDWRSLPELPDAPLKVWQDELAKRAKQKVPAAPPPPTGFAPQKFGSPLGFGPLDEGLFGVTLVETALDYVSPDVAYDEWRNLVWAIMSTGWQCAPQIVHGWSAQANKKRYDRAVANDLIRNFDSTRGITVATLFHYAKQNGWKMPQQYPPPPAPPAPLPPEPLPPLMTADQLRQLPATKYVVRNVLPEHGLAAIYGEPGSGKSFLALYLAYAIAIGNEDWFGFHVCQKPVVYVALEGVGGIGKRATAVETHRKQLCPDQLRFWCREIHLINGDKIELLTTEIVAAFGRGAVVMIDTLNQASPGADENSSQDMGKIIAASKRLASGVGGLVILIHHSGKKASQGLRGHSSLLAAMDSVIEVVNSSVGRKWSITKAKDDSAEIERDFELIPYNVGQDDFGPITSCAVQQTIHPQSPKRRVIRGKHQKDAIHELRRLLQSPGQTIDYQESLQHVAEVIVTRAGRERQRAKDAVDALIRDGHLLLNESGLSLG